MEARPAASAAAASAWKSMRGEVVLARRGEQVDETVGADRLQGFAGAAPRVHSRSPGDGAAVATEPLGELARIPVGSPLEHGADRGGADAGRQQALQIRRRLGMQRKHEVDRPQPRPCAHAIRRGLDRLVDRQRIEELVGDDDRGAARHIRHVVVPGERNAERRDVSAWRRRRNGLVSTRCTLRAAQNSRATVLARSTSAISVPRRPELDEMQRREDPINCHTATAHRPISSPNIWLISGR